MFQAMKPSSSERNGSMSAFACSRQLRTHLTCDSRMSTIGSQIKGRISSMAKQTQKSGIQILPIESQWKQTPEALPRVMWRATEER